MVGGGHSNAQFEKPEHGRSYVQLLRDRCGVAYEVPRLPPGLAEAEFVQEVRGWNETMEAELKRKFDSDIFERLQEEARRLWPKSAAGCSCSLKL